LHDKANLKMTRFIMLLGIFLQVAASQQPLELSEQSTLPIPTSIGVVGVGTIGSALVRGLLAKPALSPAPSFVLYDINTTKANALKAEFPGSNVSVATRCVPVPFAHFLTTAPTLC
jgi:hypothetical protein